MDWPTENPASNSVTVSLRSNVLLVTMEIKSTSRCIATDICRLSLMWEAPTEETFAEVTIFKRVEAITMNYNDLYEDGLTNSSKKNIRIDLFIDLQSVIVCKRISVLDAVRKHQFMFNETYFWGVEHGRCVGLTTLPPSASRLSRQCDRTNDNRSCNGLLLLCPIT
jgi:hypothetical protein